MSEEESDLKLLGAKSATFYSEPTKGSHPQNIERTPKLLAEDEPEVAQKRAKAGNQDRLAKTSGSNLSAPRSIFLPSYFVMILLLSLK